MKKTFLFPTGFRKIGWLLFIPGVIMGLANMAFGWEPELNVAMPAIYFGGSPFNQDEGGWFKLITNNPLDEVMAILIIVGALFIGFSKEKIEDEFTAKIRLDSLVWATYVNYGILLLAILFVYDFDFLNVMLYNMFTLLIFFILRYRVVMYRSSKMVGDEE
tara:strand:+ start:644 stop:1126 length:483 start_codon:yes stop_codon:yes gene_type:complete